MGIFIKNPDVERKARELAALEGKTLTAVIDEALECQLKSARAKQGRPTLEEMRQATEEFRRAIGLDETKLNVTRADFDALWELPGLDEDFDPR